MVMTWKRLSVHISRFWSKEMRGDKDGEGMREESEKEGEGRERETVCVDVIQL